MIPLTYVTELEYFGEIITKLVHGGDFGSALIHQIYKQQFVGDGNTWRPTVADPLCVYRQVPSPPGDEDEDFILVHHSDVQLSEKAEQVYAQLAKILKEQYEVRLQEKD